MRKIIISCLLLTLGALATNAQRRHHFQPRENVPTDSIVLSDPAVLADPATHKYYMTGTGGMMWISDDLKLWNGPYFVTQTQDIDWMGPRPMIWAAEPHLIDGNYYYFATFTNDSIIVDHVNGRDLPRRASHVLKAEQAAGPYMPFGDNEYLPADKLTLDGTLWIEEDGTPYLVYCHEWLQTGYGTMEAVKMKKDFSGTEGDAMLLFSAESCPWSVDGDHPERPNVVTDGPYLFRTGTGRLGMIWTSWVRDVYTQGVAYSESGKIEGPWIHEPDPITPPNFGHAMLFQDFDGQWKMSVHSHNNNGGRYHRVPHFFNVDLTGDKLKVLIEED